MTEEIKANNADDQKRSSNAKKKWLLDTLFPPAWLLLLMFLAVLAFNLVTGLKLYSLEKEKEALNILKGQYDGYAEIIKDVEDKTKRLIELTQEIVPLELRRENAIAEEKESIIALEENRKELNKIKALQSEIEEELKANRQTIAELSNDKALLRKENDKLESIVARLKDSESRTEEAILNKNKDLQDIEEKIRATSIRLEDQKKYLEDVAAANSSFEVIRGKLSSINENLDKTEQETESALNAFKETIKDIEVEKQLFSSHNSTLKNESEALSNSNTSYSGYIETLSKNNDEITNKIKILDETNRALTESSQTIGSTIKNINTDKNKLSENISKLESANTKLSSSAQDFQSTIASLKKSGVRFQEEVDGISEVEKLFANFSTSLGESITKLNSDNLAFQNGVAMLNSEISAFSESKGNLNDMNTEYAAIVEEMKSQSLELSTSLASAKDVPDLVVQLKTLTDALKTIDEAAQKLRNSSNSIQAIFDSKIKGMNLSFSGLNKEVAYLEERLSNVSQQTNSLIAELKQTVKQKN